jgi:hypothetical protein
MGLKSYFDRHNGVGVLSTTDDKDKILPLIGPGRQSREN